MQFEANQCYLWFQMDLLSVVFGGGGDITNVHQSEERKFTTQSYGGSHHSEITQQPGKTYRSALLWSLFQLRWSAKVLLWRLLQTTLVFFLFFFSAVGLFCCCFFFI